MERTNNVDYTQGLVKALEGITDISVKKEIMLGYVDYMHATGTEKAKQLSDKLNRKVRYALYTGTEKEDAALAYYTTPRTELKLRVTDIMTQSPTRAAVALFDATVLKEESDKRIFEKDEDRDFFYLAALDDVVNQWRKADIAVKKK